MTTSTYTGRSQQIFNPVDYCFAWTADGWYTWDRPAAFIAARRARDEAAREAFKAGHQVRKFTLRDQLISRGGIGSGKPHVDFVVTCYGVNIY